MPSFRILTPVLLLVLAACSGGSDLDQPKASEFAAGECRELAGSVLALGKGLDRMSSKPPTSQQREALKTGQTELRSHQTGLSAALAAPVQQLVTTVGVLRIRADTNSYEQSLAQDAMSAYEAVVAACT